MAQGAEGTGVRVVPGDGADACDALPEIDPQLGSAARDVRCQVEPVLLPIPGQCDVHTAVGPVQGPADILCCVDLHIVNGDDLVPDLDARFPGAGEGIVKCGHSDPVIPELQADHLSHRDQRLRRQGGDGQK